MVDYTPTWSLPHPAAADSVLPESRDFASLAVTTDAALTDVKTQVLAEVGPTLGRPRALSTSDHLDDLRTPGAYGVVSNAIGAAVGMPSGVAGTVTVEHSGNQAAGGLVVQRVWEYDGASRPRGGYLWTRSSMTTGTWSPWRQSYDSQMMGTDPATQTSLDVLKTPGTYGIISNGVGIAVGMPTGKAGTVTVEHTGNQAGGGLLIQRAWEYDGTTAATGGLLWFRSTATTGLWSEWQQLWPSPGGAASGLTGHGHAVRLSDSLRRRGGPIGTGGKAVVALRFDHGLANFRDIILPELRRLALPWSIAINSNRWDATENGGVTPEYLQNMAHQTGGEVWNHGRSHGDASTIPALTTEIVQALTELETQMPALHIEGWAIPGVGGTGYGGFSTGSTPEEWDTAAGRLILEHHAFATGHQRGHYRSLYGAPQVGSFHRTIDAATTAGPVITAINECVSQGSGMTLMAHPSLINASGQYTTAVLIQILEHLAAERDAGRLVVLPMTGLELADARSRNVHNALPPMTSSSNVAAGASMSRVRLASAAQHYRGIPRVAAVDIDMSSAGTVVIAVAGCGSRSFTVPAGRRTISRWVTVPKEESEFLVTVTPSAPATVHQIELAAGPTPAPDLANRDTGWRDIQSFVPGYIDGKLVCRRVGKVVEIAAEGLRITGTGSFDFTDPLGAGWSPGRPLYTKGTEYWASVVAAPVRIWTDAKLSGQFGSAVDPRIHFQFIYTTTDAWPTTLPGTPA